MIDDTILEEHDPLDHIAKDQRIAELVREVDQLTTAMRNRAAIEQAKGVIMHTMRCGPDAAFAVLVVQSQNENRKLADVAKELVDAQDASATSGSGNEASRT